MVLTVETGNNYIYRDPQKNQIHPTQGKHRVILSLKDCQVIFLDLPPLKDRDLRPIIEQKLPFHYPHSLEDVTWDFQKTKGEVRVFVVKKELLLQIREDLGPGTRFFCSAQNLPLPEEKSIYKYSFSEGEDLYFFDGESQVRSFFSLSQRDISPLINDFLNSPGPVHELTSPIGKAPLFCEAKKSPSLFWLYSILPIILVGLLSRSFYKTSRLESQLTLQENVIEKLKSDRGDSKEEFPWEETLELLIESEPIDYYEILDTLTPYFSGKAKIVNLSIQGDTIKIQAEGRDALSLMESLKGEEKIDELSLYQIKREANEELFSLSARWK